MNRRGFLTGLFGVAAATAAAAAFAPAAKAAQAESLLDTLQGMDAGTVENPLAATDADLPAEGAQETQFYFGVRRRPVYRRAYYRPIVRRRVVYRRPRCVWVRNRFGRVIRRCY